ncbi:MAG: hypothetical protein LBL48_08240 [Azoarcus sp.]|jgi:DNA-binding phage protein|nr:hypothetical protein [Azoarcus sp.]
MGRHFYVEAAGIAREALYKALRPGSPPRFEIISRVCAALGVKLAAYPRTEILPDKSSGNSHC